MKFFWARLRLPTTLNSPNNIKKSYFTDFLPNINSPTYYSIGHKSRFYFFYFHPELACKFLLQVAEYETYFCKFDIFLKKSELAG